MINHPPTTEGIADFMIGDVICLSGIIFTARNMAHIGIMEHQR